MTVADHQVAAINRLLEDEAGQQKYIEALVPALRRRGQVNIVSLLQVWEPRLHPGYWKRLARVLYAAAKKAGVTIIDDAIPAAHSIPSAEWVEEWITPGISCT